MYDVAELVERNAGVRFAKMGSLRGMEIVSLLRMIEEHGIQGDGMSQRLGHQEGLAVTARKDLLNEWEPTKHALD